MRRIFLAAVLTAMASSASLAADRPMIPLVKGILSFVPVPLNAKKAPGKPLPILQRPLNYQSMAIFTTLDRELVFALKNENLGTLPVPLDQTVRFAQALMDASDACAPDLSGEKKIDEINWQSIPLPAMGKTEPVAMGVKISASGGNVGHGCLVHVIGDNSTPIAADFFLPKDMVSHVINALPNIDATAAAWKPSAKVPTDLLSTTSPPLDVAPAHAPDGTEVTPAAPASTDQRPSDPSK